MTAQTYKAALLTTKSMLECIEQLLKKGYRNILTGVFQTDMLEHMFSILREILGSNYHIGGKACIQAIDKLRKSSVIDLVKSLDELISGIEDLKKPKKEISAENLNSKILDYASKIFDRSGTNRLVFPDRR